MIERRAQARAGFRLLILLWVFIAAVVVYLAFNLWSSLRRTERLAGEQALSFARLVAEHATATIDRANVTIKAIEDVLRPEDFQQAGMLSAARREAIEQELKVHQGRAFGMVSMSVTNADGYVFANSVGVRPGLSLADRKYFQELKAGPRSLPVVSEAIFGRVSQKWGIQIARRVEMPDGRFAGMIVANLGIAENFETFYRSINLGKDSFIALLDAESRLLVRYPAKQELIATRVGRSAGTEAIEKGLFEAVVRSVSPVDQIDRMVALRRTRDFPINALVGLSREAALDAWARDLGRTLAFIAAMLLAAGLMTRELLIRKQAEAALHAASEAAKSSSEAKTKFLAAASHDLRQPMQAINLFLAALKNTDLDENQRRMMGFLSQAAASQAEMLDTLLDITRLDSGAVRPALAGVDGEWLFEQLDAEFAPLFLERGLRFKLYFPARTITVLTDPALLLNLLRNVVGNALKYTEKGGVLIALRRRGQRAMLQVWDTGIGIAEDELAHIFDEYFQVGNLERDRSKGLGLGLAIVKRIAKLIEAEVSCRSRQGRGTVFSVDLPLASRQDGPPPLLAVAQAVPMAPAEAAAWAGRKLVIVEDDALVVRSLEQSLSSLGCKVAAFREPAAALADPAADDADYYVTDLRLAGDMDGIQLLQAFANRAGRPIRAVVLTGDTAPDTVSKLRGCPWPVRVKPTSLDVVLAALVQQGTDAAG